MACPSLGAPGGPTVTSVTVQVVRDIGSMDRPTEGSVVTIGAYDGVHLGHQAVIAAVRNLADQLEARSTMVTFDRHPALVVRPESAPKLLTDTDQKLELLAETGINTVVLLTFDASSAVEPAEDFVHRVLVNALATRALAVGADFHFGHRRRGNVELLSKIGAEAGFEVHPLELLGARSDDRGRFQPAEVISSTAIRQALGSGDVERAATMLGRPHEVRGVVVEGDHRGRQIGFPTANVMVHESICIPADGVYAGWFVTEGGDRHRCAVNIGRRPTFYAHAEHSLVEAHLLDFDGDLYGQRAGVRFGAFLRPEVRFDGVEALVAQLRLDVAAVRSRR
jgi:riboflavin kinase / FMN adenylyltransferase